MSDKITLLQRVGELNKSPGFSAYSKVVIHIDDDTDIVAGDDLGRTLEITNPYGTQQMAQDLLAKLNGYQYQPFTANSALLDPAAEIGDGVSIKDVYGGMYTRVRTFNRLMTADISAPHDEEVNHEYKFETPQERKVKRQFENVKATFEVQATEIAAKVSKTGGNRDKTFAWSLDADGFYIHNGEITDDIKSNGSALFTFKKSGLSIKGKITATSGFIGDETNGFKITASSISNNKKSLNDNKNGVYIGKDGIALGKSAFVATSDGSISAVNMSLSGTLTVAGTQITAENLRLGAERCNSGYSNWNGTTSTVNSNKTNWTSGYTWTSNAGNSSKGVGYIRATEIYAVSKAWLPSGGTYIGDNLLSLRTETISGKSIAFVGWGY